jgi:hypothetical protein
MNIERASVAISDGKGSKQTAKFFGHKRFHGEVTIPEPRMVGAEVAQIRQATQL